MSTENELIQALAAEFGIEIDVSDTVMRIWHGERFCGVDSFSVENLQTLLDQQRNERAQAHVENADRIAQRQAELAPLTEKVAVVNRFRWVIGHALVSPGTKSIGIADLITMEGKVLCSNNYRVSRSARNLRRAGYVDNPLTFYKGVYTYMGVNVLGELIHN